MRITRTPRTAPTTRRTLLRASAATAAAGVLAAGSSPVGAAPRTRSVNAARPATPAAALKELAAGNHRWRTLHQRHPHETAGVRSALVSGQSPFALILGCIDSRVPRSWSSTKGSAT